MKRALFQCFNFLMACVVLLSSTGFGLVEHSCQMRGKKKTMVVAFSEAKVQAGCALDSQPSSGSQPVLKKTECCQDDQHYENVDISSSLSQFVAKLVKVIAESVVAGVVAMVTWLMDWVFARETSSISASSAFPSLSGRAILTLYQTLLI